MTTRGLSVQRKPVDGAVEPVTIEDLKLHLAIDSNDHDDLLNKLLPAARLRIEKYIGLSLIESDLKVRWEELTSDDLPYGPVLSEVNVEGSDDCSFEGFIGAHMRIVANSSSPITVTYRAGFEDGIEEDLQLAIMKLATDNFSKREGFSITGNDSAKPLPNDWKSTAAPYSVKSWFL